MIYQDDSSWDGYPYPFGRADIDEIISGCSCMWIKHHVSGPTTQVVAYDDENVYVLLTTSDGGHSTAKFSYKHLCDYYDYLCGIYWRRCSRG